jgi:ribosomal protein S17
MFFAGERMEAVKVKVQIYQKHPKVQVFWDMGKKINYHDLASNMKALR